MKGSAFIIALGNSPKIRLLDFFLGNDVFDYTKSEVAAQAGISRVTLNQLWPELVKSDVLKKKRRIANATLYKLNNDSAIVKKLKELDFLLSKELGSKVMVRQRQQGQNSLKKARPLLKIA